MYRSTHNDFRQRSEEDSDGRGWRANRERIRDNERGHGRLVTVDMGMPSTSINSRCRSEEERIVSVNDSIVPVGIEVQEKGLEKGPDIEKVSKFFDRWLIASRTLCRPDCCSRMKYPRSTLICSSRMRRTRSHPGSTRLLNEPIRWKRESRDRVKFAPGGDKIGGFIER
jgi:hypothetical protein